MTASIRRNTESRDCTVVWRLPMRRRAGDVLPYRRDLGVQRRRRSGAGALSCPARAGTVPRVDAGCPVSPVTERSPVHRRTAPWWKPHVRGRLEIVSCHVRELFSGQHRVLVSCQTRSRPTSPGLHDEHKVARSPRDGKRRNPEWPIACFIHHGSPKCAQGRARADGCTAHTGRARSALVAHRSGLPPSARRPRRCGPSASAESMRPLARAETVVPPRLEVEHHGLQRQLSVHDVAGNRHAVFRAHVRSTVEWLVDCGVQVPTNRCRSRILPPDGRAGPAHVAILEPFSYFYRLQARQDDLNVVVVTTSERQDQNRNRRCVPGGRAGRPVSASGVAVPRLGREHATDRACDPQPGRRRHRARRDRVIRHDAGTARARADRGEALGNHDVVRCDRRERAARPAAPA